MFCRYFDSLIGFKPKNVKGLSNLVDVSLEKVSDFYPVKKLFFLVQGSKQSYIADDDTPFSPWRCEIDENSKVLHVSSANWCKWVRVWHRRPLICVFSFKHNNFPSDKTLCKCVSRAGGSLASPPASSTLYSSVFIKLDVGSQKESRRRLGRIFDYACCLEAPFNLWMF